MDMACGDACGSGTFGGLRRRAGRCERSARRFWRGCGGALCHQRRDGGAKRFAFAQRFGHGAHSERNPGLANGSCAYAVRHEQLTEEDNLLRAEAPERLPARLPYFLSAARAAWPELAPSQTEQIRAFVQGLAEGRPGDAALRAFLQETAP